MDTIIWGKRAVLESLTAKMPINDIYIAENYHEKEDILIEISNIRGAVPGNIKIVNRRILEKLSGYKNKSGIAAKLKLPEGRSFTDLENAQKKIEEASFLVVLDHLEDPQNVGAIIRSAEGAGVHGIIIPRARNTGITEAVARTSSGAIFHLPVTTVANIPQTLDRLKKSGLWIVGTDYCNATNYYDVDLTLPIAIVIGSEGRGMNSLVRKKCDFIAKIPLMGKVQSLNASASAAVILFETVRQRILQRKI